MAFFPPKFIQTVAASYNVDITDNVARDFSYNVEARLRSIILVRPGLRD